MHIPKTEADIERFLRLVIDSCMASQQERRTLYEKRRRYYLYGQNTDEMARDNALASHIELVASFLYSPDGLVFNITPPKNASEEDVQKFLALQDSFNEDIHDSGLADVFAEAVLWGINYDTMVLKIGWNDHTDQLFAYLTEPSCFGVYREDLPDFAAQPAYNHSFLLDYDEAVERLRLAGKLDRIGDVQIEGASNENGLPPALTQLIISATGGENITGNIMGTVNPNYEAGPHFRANLTAPMVRFHETWVWDSELKDVRIFHCLQGPVLLSDSVKTIKATKAGNKKIEYDSESNWFLKGENPFVPVTPYTLYNYFWGRCQQERIIPLQNWYAERLEQIDEILKRQEDPSKSFIGFQGIPDEKAEAFGGPGSWVAESMPGAKVEEHPPQMPEDLFRESDKIVSLMMQASGLTEVVSGRSSGGARGGAQQKQMQITGGGQIRKVAVGLESALVRMGDIALKLKMKNDDTKIKLPSGEEFVAAQVPDGYSLHVGGHSHSPLFRMETEELATLLFKARAIGREWLIRMLNPPEKGNLLHALHQTEAAEAKAAQEKAAKGEAEKRSHEKKT